MTKADRDDRPAASGVVLGEMGACAGPTGTGQWKQPNAVSGGLKVSRPAV